MSLAGAGSSSGAGVYMMKKLLLITSAVSISFAGELILPSNVLQRDGVVHVKWHMSGQVSGTGRLNLRWTDSLGRVVQDSSTPVTLTDEEEFSFPLDLRRAVAMQNHLVAHLSLQGTNLKGAVQREEDAKVTFIARPSNPRWTDYEITMWQQYPAKLQPALQKLGITSGQYSGRAEVPPEMFIGNDMRWYAENIGTDFYSEYHRYRPDRIQHWSFLQAKEMLKKDPNSKEAFKRHPSLWDPVWRTRIQERLEASAKRYSPYRPLFYSLADESGLADLAAFWDFDFSDESIVPMRRWLQSRYGTLQALNSEWETKFGTWDAVIPPTTHETMQRPGDNFTAWADFKEWMDISFADALEMGRRAVERVDPFAYVSIGGGQRPGWGGYDYARLTKALSAIEPYDIGNSVEVIRSLNPAMPMVSTGFANGPWEQQRVWRELFHGQRGLIIWDEKHEYVDTSGTPGARGLEASKYYNEIRNGIGAQLINSQPLSEPIAIHYSQASMRTEWMLARRPEGDKWVDRGAKTERTDDEFLRLRESWCELIEDQGMQYKFVSYDQVEKGELLKQGYRVLVLPRSSSLSEAEVEGITDFVQHGGTVLADGIPGTFNERSRRLKESPLAHLFTTANRPAIGKAVLVKADTLNYLTDRLLKKEGAVHSAVGNLLRQDIRPYVQVTDGSGKAVVGVEVHAFRNGGVTLITLLSNPLQRVDELGPPDFKSNGRFETAVRVKVTLPYSSWLYDMRTGQSLGQKLTFDAVVQPYEPNIIAASPSQLPALRLAVPQIASRGGLLNISLATERTPAATSVFHVEVAGPNGDLLPHYSGNVLANDGRALKSIPLAVNDPAGEWTIRVRDVLSGQSEVRKVAVR